VEFLSARTDLRDIHDAAAARLTAGEHVYTSGRRELVELLAARSRPVTIADLLETRPRLTQSSVYRNMAILDEVGVVQKIVSSDDRARYELSEELMGHHHHLVCTSCGLVDDFVVPARAERSIETILERAIASTGFRASGHRIDVVGLCANCA
jgi:Fe2+ or Zn2+ uptake regulation protein